ncbi:hypothetical protein TSOC_011540 [Tetrabaena socialis]|uniref:MIB/HERC2 domain-containing protein n=1 Tax=Tetrabaena socialis TaxID=47790 RepID=A0A2J7ZQD6_9CHLO|nr:hypothetical protein TSOC_011540 [Tetrabaena socialis]|eukprot:PNH02479.1 hypothetical protein TSOC_011540 [Tetrabaena socialis]
MLLLSSRACLPGSLGFLGCLAARRVLALAPSHYSHQLLHSQQHQLLLTSPWACTAASAASGDPPAKPAAELSADGGAGRPAERATKRSGRAVELMAAALRSTLSEPTLLAALRADPIGELALLRSELARQAPRWDAGDVVTPENCRVGLKVVRGPDWSEWSNADGGEGGAGTIVRKSASPDLVYVQWESLVGEADSERLHYIVPSRYELCCAVPYTV